MSRLWTRIMVAAALATCVVAARADDAFRLLQIDGHSVKWGAPVLGQGATISFAVVNGPSKITGNINCLHINGIGPLLSHSHMTRRAFDRELAAALATWQSAANIRFIRAKLVAKADIVFSAEAQPDGIGYADVTLSGSGEHSVSRLRRGIVCLNPDIRWIANSGSAHESDSAVQLRYALAHELGHVLGLDHPGPEGELMSFEYGTHFDGLKPGDMAGIAALYGKRNPVPVLALASRSPSVR